MSCVLIFSHDARRYKITSKGKAAAFACSVFTKTYCITVIGLTREYPATPKVILKRVATWLRGYVATWLRGYVATWLRGYAATWLRSYVAAQLRVRAETNDLHMNIPRSSIHDETSALIHEPKPLSCVAT